ncbi:AfsR/SARP family transcriptional regulator [Streptomyces phytophilus]|uniref:AfsR/SARP family transcriptional regulator n=1 Tax=Streptomyces phytophilus TaxID=722715 RepID=UPI0015EFF1C9|nr:tetratricopeptide repeat protein [Streptomyces phytophilus]
MELRILLLGAVELRAGEERAVLKAPKERLTLAALAWDAGRTVSVDTLVHRVWDDHPPAKPREALYVHLHHIRKMLSALAGPHGPTITNNSHTYTLQADPDTVDLRRYLTLLDQARWLADGGSDREALAAVQEASRLWGGEPLAGLPGTWAAQLRSFVEERNLTTARLQADVAVRLGHYAEAVTGLQPLAEREPADESVASQLALALHGCGRTEAASRLLQRTRQHILRESGAEPGAEFQHIHRGILARTPVAALLPSASSPACPALVPETLPPDVPWVGRQAELERLTGMLASTVEEPGSTGVTAAAVTGMPGSGKTALAVHAAHQLREHFPDGRLFLELRGHAPHQAPMSSAEALGELLRLLGIPPAALPQDLNGLIALWRTTVRGRRFVAVLDDAASAEQVTPLLPGDSSPFILITSRHRLTGLPGVQHLALDILPRTDAVALLQRLLDNEERNPGTEEAATLARLCGDLPLALTLIARRLLSRPAWRVSDLMDSFNRARRRLPEIRDHNDAMASALEVSYRALTPTQQKVFRRLGLHIGSEFSPEAAAALTGLPWEEAEHVLEELLACCLIFEPAPHRYRLHDLLREYASTLAEEDAASENQHALARLIHHYLHTADRADRRAYPHRLRIALPAHATTPPVRHNPQQWFTAEGPSLLAALEYARAHGSPRQSALLTHTLAGFMSGEGYLSTATPLLRAAVAYWQTTRESAAHGRALIDLAGVCAGAGHYDEALDSARKALELAQAAGDEELEAEALHQQSITCWHTARHTDALNLQQRALRLRLAGTDRLQQGRSYNLLGMICLRLERHKDALKYFLEGRARFRDIGDQRGQFIAVHNLAELHKEAGNLDSAIGSYRQAISLSQAPVGTGQYAILQMNLADTLCRHGRPEEALGLYDKVLPALRSAGDRRSEAIAHIGIGQALHAAGRSEQALPHHTAALTIARTIRAALEECQALRALSEAEAATGRLAQARGHLRAGLALSRKINSGAEETEMLQALSLLQRNGTLPLSSTQGDDMNA